MSDPADRFRKPAREFRQDADTVPSAPGGLWILAATLCALVLLWLVIRVSVANALLETRPDAAAALAPKHPEAVLAAADAAEQANGLSERRDAAIPILPEAPLAEQPLLFAARLAIQNGDTQHAELLLNEAIRRDPRSRYGLLLRLDQQLRQSRVDDAAVTVAVLSRLLPNSGPLLIGELARMARNPEVRGAIARVLKTDPGMRTELLEALARQGADPDTIFSLAGHVEPAAVGQTPPWQAIMLSELVNRGEVARARQVWNRLAGAEQTPRGAYDADFKGLPGPRPFNWKFETSPEGFAEPASGGGLYAEFYGREDAVLGEQLLTLSPRAYRVAFEAEGSADGEGGRLAWTVACQANGRTLATVPIMSLETSSKAFFQTFTVPNGCAAQWLRLTGKFGEFPKDQRVTISNFRIEEARRP